MMVAPGLPTNSAPTFAPAALKRWPLIALLLYPR